MIRFGHYALRWPLYMTAIFCAYTLLLLWNIFTSEAQLRATIDTRLVAEGQRRGAALGEYAQGLQQRMEELARRHEIEAYLANKALGMSEQYGLFANLTAIEQLFQQTLKRELVDGSPIYREIIFFDATNTPLTAPFDARMTLQVPEGVGLGTRLLIDESKQELVVSAPVFHKGRFQGAVIAAGDLEQLARLLTAGPTLGKDRSHQEILLAGEGFSLRARGSALTVPAPVARSLARIPDNVLVPLADLADAPVDLAPTLALRTAVEGTPLVLITLIDPNGVYGHLISRTYLYTFSIFPFLLFLGVIILERQRQSSEKLLSDNTALSDEIERRTVLEHQLREKTEGLEQLAMEFETIAERAEEASKAKSQFLANMSHELRTPMNAIIGMSYLALQGELSGQRREQLTFLHQAAKSLMATINNLLDFSAVEAGTMTLEPAPLVLGDLLEALILQLQPQLEEKQLQFHYEKQDPVLAPGAPLLLADGQRLGQILTNLLMNAIQFTEKGFVRLAVSSSATEPVRITFTVEDSGIGMKSEQVSRLFEEFTQADGSTTREHGGTGLGLTIAGKLVALMGGTMAVTSSPGLGSCFTVAICFATAQGDGAPANGLQTADDDFSALQGVRVLLVEDNPVNRLLARGLLAKQGVVVDLAGNGEEAIEKLQRSLPGTFAAVLMDLQMPVLDGYQAAGVIRSQPIYEALPIIALSALDTDAEQERCRQVGINGFISKPYHPELLWRTLLDTINQDQSPRRLSLPTIAAPLPPPGSAIPGVELDQALQRVHGDQQLYGQLVVEVTRTFASAWATLLELARAKKYQEGQGYAHTLRGLLGTIGAVEMAKSMAAAEESFRQGQDPQELILALEQPYAALMAGLQKYLQETDALGVKADDPVGTSQAGADPAWLEELAACLEKGDFQAIELWDNNKHSLTHRLPPPTLERINRALHNFDFARALELLPLRAEQ